MRTLAVTCSVLLALANTACYKPPPPETERPPDPQAQLRTEPQHTELRDAIKQPIDRAKAVEQEVLDAAEKQQADIDAQTGG